MIVVPPDFAADLARRFGAAGRDWTAALPAAVEDLCERWALDAPRLLGSGTWSVVWAVRREGRAAALKVAWPLDGGALEREARVLRLWDGRGAVRVLDADVARRALLLERLDPGRRLAHVGVEEALRVAGGLLRRHAVPAPPGVPALAAITDDLTDGIEARWERLGRPTGRAVIERTRALARRLRPGIGARLVNWDVHDDNVLRGDREPWLVIDPQVVSGDVEYGVAQLLWGRLEDIEARGGVPWALDVLTRAADLDPARLAPWVYVRTAAYWLSGLEGGLTLDPARCGRVLAALEAHRGDVPATFPEDPPR